MAQTGMETARILLGIIKEVQPDLVIAIDALAARSIRRLGTTIQLTDTGIHPGSGVGNHRHSLTKETLGIPVLAIGVPTVVVRQPLFMIRSPLCLGYCHPRQKRKIRENGSRTWIRKISTV